MAFENGSEVKKGDLLYRLDSVKYEAAVKNAEAKVAECTASLGYAELAARATPADSAAHRRSLVKCLVMSRYRLVSCHNPHGRAKGTAPLRSFIIPQFRRARNVV